MNSLLAPASVSELVEAVRSTPRLLAVGAGTKPRPAEVDAVKLSVIQLRGIIEYDPSEFTFTARAGTPMREIADALAERGQYLPFDPFFVEAGATLGGTVAAGLSGPGRLRFGGLRDFILGVQFVDGRGRLLRLGGKVVKNAAGFDIPKFFVGSLGRFGVLTELTFKVFPRAASTLTLKLPTDGMATSVRMLTESANTRWEPVAVDVLPDDGRVCLRLAGPANALSEISREILARWPGETLSAEAADKLWSDLREFRWTHVDGPLIKVALTPATLPAFDQKMRELAGIRIHVSAGGNMAFVSLPSASGVATLNDGLRGLGLSGMTLRGNAPLWLGAQPRPKIAQAVKDALDPEHRFPLLDD
jgi:glycolate oxidase FAD binding subunit